MPKPICVKCGLFFKPKENGVMIEEGRPINNGNWAPYKLWRADLYSCKGCGTEIVVGFAREPCAEHHMAEKYLDAKNRQPPIVFVKDC